jgi:hypothetical protein
MPSPRDHPIKFMTGQFPRSGDAHMDYEQANGFPGYLNQS